LFQIFNLSVLYKTEIEGSHFVSNKDCYPALPKATPMMDSDGAQSTAGFDYDRDGHVIPPACSLPWDIATVFFAMAIPVIAMRISMHSPLSPLGLQNLKISELAIARAYCLRARFKTLSFFLWS
jgi:hypothetical protein